MSDHDALAHLAGYSTLALILGTATWSTFGWVFALPLLFATVTYAGWRGYHALLTRARPAKRPEATAATDGGRLADEHRPTTTSRGRNAAIDNS